jgi:hypothetical protein
MSVLNLDQPSHGDTFKIFLRFLENKIGPRNCPTFRYPGKRDGASRGETHIICGAHGEVGEEHKVADRVCTQLEVAHRNAMFGLAAQRTEVDGVDIDRDVEIVECFRILGGQLWLLGDG